MQRKKKYFKFKRGRESELAGGDSTFHDYDFPQI